MRCHLTRLQTFTYKYHCTDQVVEQLALHCSQLRTVSLSNSAAVHNLLRLQKLNFVDVSKTSISCESYQALLKKFPEVANIICQHQYEGVLNNLGTEILDTVTTYRGSFRSTEILTQICPNITELILYEVYDDHSNLASVCNLESFGLFGGNCLSSNLRMSVRDLGRSVSDLHLNRFINVDISHIIYVTALT
jgi:hypothetical protein